jgi:hypothetical protein
MDCAEVRSEDVLADVLKDVLETTKGVDDGAGVLRVEDVSEPMS